MSFNKVTQSSQVRIPQNAEPYFNRNWGSCNEHFIALYLFWLLNASIKSQNRKTNCGAIEKYTVSKANLDSSENMLLLKNPQFLPKHFETLSQ